MTLSADTLAKFSALYVPEPNSGCWLWTGGVSADGYGRFYCEGRSHPAARISYRLFRGDVPQGLLALHKCDNPPCVNPDHIFIGTYSDNTQDMLAKGRGNFPAGDTKTQAKLTEAQVLAILRDQREGTVVAEKYGVSPSNIWLIRHNKAWTHIPRASSPSTEKPNV